MKKEISEKAAAKQIERVGLAALLTYNEFIPELMTIFKPEYFNWKEHGTLYSLACSIYKDSGSVDINILIFKLDQIGLKEVAGLNMSEYVQSLCGLPVNKDHVMNYFREIYKMHKCRTAFLKLGQAQNLINSSLDKSLVEILAEVQKLTTEAVTANIEESARIVKVYKELPNFLEQQALQKDITKLDTGFPIFDRFYGGFVFGGVYVFAAPAKVGKSTFLNHLAYQMAAIKKNKLKILILDTELESKYAMSRAATSLTQLNEIDFLSGDFARNADYAAKTKAGLNSIDPWVVDRIGHVYVENRSIEEIIAISRRWYVNEVKDGECALIIYDYIKLSGGESALSEHWKEYQEIGEKTDKLKKFVSSLPRAALATSVQTNAQGNIAMSQQIKWFANNVYILNRKSPEEIQEDGPENGTHKLVEVVTRNLGRDADQSKYFTVKTPDGRINAVNNWINFDIRKFRVDELNTNKDVYTKKGAQLKTKKSEDIDTEF